MENTKRGGIGKLLGALASSLGIGAALVWYYDIYIHWDEDPSFVISLALAGVLLFAQVVLLTLLTLRARGEKRLAGKAALSAAAFAFALVGVSAIINNLIGKGGLNRQACCVAIPLAAMQVIVLLFLFLRATGRLGKKLGAALLAVFLAATALSGALAWPKTAAPNEPFARLDIFQNSVEDSIPQWKIHDIILAHFEKERADGKTPKCLFVGYDGCRSDALANIVAGESGITALQADGGGLYNAYAGGDPPRIQDTSTGPGWTTMLTGHWADEPGGTGHTIVTNGINKTVEPKLVFTQLLEQGLARKTAFVVSWGGHFEGEGASYRSDIAYWAENNLNAAWQTTPSDAHTYRETMAQIQSADAPDMVMCILEHCDHAGHATGFSNKNPLYVQAFRQSDREALALIDAVKARGTYAQEDWLILISTDHGGSSLGHGSQLEQCRQTWLALNKPV
ncbi:MAG: alkaline phosphatase family protein [Oscillospiraceae bacterium]|jgi:hypothetical protein|nr:alkaline phosphatase family protein [Oscillospiraceae bacterium]